MADEWQPVTRFIAGAALIRLVCTVKSGMLSSASPSLCHLLPVLIAMALFQDSSHAWQLHVRLRIGSHQASCRQGTAHTAAH